MIKLGKILGKLQEDTGLTLNKVIADPRLTAFKKEGLDTDDVPPETGMMTSDIGEDNALSDEQCARLYNALQLNPGEVPPEEFRQDLNIELKNYPSDGQSGYLKKILLLTLANLKRDPNHYN